MKFFKNQHYLDQEIPTQHSNTPKTNKKFYLTFFMKIRISYIYDYEL